MNGGPTSTVLETARRPGTAVRLLLLLLAVGGSFLVLSLGFSPGAPDRLPALLFAVGLALLAAWRPERALLLFCLLFPLAGLLDRLFGGIDPVAWPTLFFGGLASGWCFRFLYDFESVPDPTPLDATLRALVAVWAMATLLAVFRARTLWAVLHGLSGRIVNGDGLPEAAAVRESVLALAVLAGGASFFYLLRRAGAAMRRRALGAAVAGASLSALVSLLQAAGAAPSEAGPFWKLTGRLSGGAVDPNSLGLLCGLALGPALALLLSASRGLLPAAPTALVLAAGLVLSGSRSGLLLGLSGTLALLVLPGLPKRTRWAGFATFAVAVGVAVFLLARGTPGSVGNRILHSFDPQRPFEDRVSARPILWKSALLLFERHPLAGAGMGAYSWELPDLAREQGVRLPQRDNPGNAYLQALCETGPIGFAMTGLFLLLLAGHAMQRLRSSTDEPIFRSSAVAVLAFLGAMLVGSHWLAADGVFLFFLLCAVVARPGEEGGRTARRARALLAVAYGVAVAVAILSTARLEEAFRHSARIGFHGLEKGPGGPFRWTGRRFGLWLRPGETVRLGLAHFTPEGRPVEVVASASGSILLRRTFQPGQGRVLRLKNPGARPTAFLFRLSRAFVPMRLGLSGDRRELGLVSVELPGS